MTLYWLSFCDDTYPAGQKFRGGLAIEAAGFVEAIEKATRLGMNPGGEVLGGQLPDGPPYDTPPVPIGKLLDAQQSRKFINWVDAYWNGVRSQRHRVCQECNEP